MSFSVQPPRARDPLHALELVLLGREAALSGDPLAEHRLRPAVGRLQRARVDGGEREVEPGAREPRRRGCALAQRAPSGTRSGSEDPSSSSVSVSRGARAPSATVQKEGVPGSFGSLRERAHDQAHAADAVHERVVDLAVHREAVAFEALDQVDLPQRPVEVELVAVQSRDEHAELALAARVRECGVAHVVVEVDVVDLAHQRQARADERRLEELQVPGRWHRALRAHAREQRPAGSRRGRRRAA